MNGPSELDNLLIKHLNFPVYDEHSKQYNNHAEYLVWCQGLEIRAKYEIKQLFLERAKAISGKIGEDVFLSYDVLVNEMEFL